MKIRMTQPSFPIILLICLFTSGALSQVRRRPIPKQRTGKPLQLEPLTSVQKKVVSDLIERAKSLELTYQTDITRFTSAAESLGFSLGDDNIRQLPAGPIRTYLMAMVYGYHDAGVLLGMLFREGFNNSFYEAQATVSGINRRPQIIEEIGRRWKVNIMQVGLRQAQRQIFDNASALKNKLVLLLARTPTADIPSSTQSSDWLFPTPRMRGEYSALTKTTMYDLGEGFSAGHIEIAPGVPAVAMFFLVPIPKEEVSDADLALAFASKVVKLSNLLSDTVLAREKDSEYRFRTANGKVLIVALNANREMAILRFE